MSLPQIDTILDELCSHLDITDSQFESAVTSYKAVGAWLDQEGSELKKYRPHILPQGSFLLGTIIKPIYDDAELDIDLVCCLERKPESCTQAWLKMLVGKRLKDHGKYKSMLKSPEWNRCWTLQYADEAHFHLDILPAITHDGIDKVFPPVRPNVAGAPIYITDKRNSRYLTSPSISDWPKSDPFGYSRWFQGRMTSNVFSLQKSIEPVPPKTVKTTLQKVVQILKRHRDIMFKWDEHMPISMIITTLAAEAYNYETSLWQALTRVLQNMCRFVVQTSGISEILNPVNKEENFADKWSAVPKKEENFYRWLNQVQADLFRILGSNDTNEVYDNIYRNLWVRLQPKVFVPQSKVFTSQVDISHKEKPRWPMRLSENINISAYYISDDRHHIPIEKTTTIPKHCALFFTCKHSIVGSFEVYWQVVNTWIEAKNNNALRGDIFASETAWIGGVIQKEKSQFTWSHSIECYIVRNKDCIWHSGIFPVNIA